jgi:hypothetical protein
MHQRRRRLTSALVVVATVFAVLLSHHLISPQATLATSALLQPAPTPPRNYFDYFGRVLDFQQGSKLALRKGLNPYDPISYQRIGAVRVNNQLRKTGENIFFNRGIGNPFLGRIFGNILGPITPEINEAIRNLQGQPTTNLQIALQKDLPLGSRVYAKGTVINTGIDVKPGGQVFGFSPTFGLTCATCHATLSGTPNAKTLEGVPNGDLNIPFLLALASNTSSGFARLDFNPLDPKYQGNGKTILDSSGRSVRLPDPQKFEAAFDDAVLNVPSGNFESSPDNISNTTQIPSIFTFKTGPYGFDGQFAVGPFAGLSSITNAVHSSELNLVAASQLSQETIGIDREVYLGTLLQNAADPSIRLPSGSPVKPSEWLRKVAPDALQAELENEIPAPGTGTYPNLRPSLFTYNGGIFSPKTNQSNDIASGPFLFAVNAMSAWQNSLSAPPNRSLENEAALKSGSVHRGAVVFQKANCATCHIPPYFTDNVIHPISEIKSNPARAINRLAFPKLLVPPKLYALNTPVPIPANAEVINVPTKGISDTPTTLPKGILPNGGYKTLSLLGINFSAPYLHDGGVSVRKNSLQIDASGNVTVTDPTGLGLPGTLRQGISPDSASSLRALVDSKLRSQVVAANKGEPELVRGNLDGTGHNFYVDRTTGFTVKQQTDLVNFLMALDNDPGRF